MRRAVDAVLELRGPGFRLRVTPEHPFWVPGEGWTNAGRLTSGDTLLAAGGVPVPIEEVRVLQGSFLVHNLEVEDTHTFLVGARGILVHNKERCR